MSLSWPPELKYSVRDIFIEYTRDSRYPYPEDEPAGDSLALFIETTPIFKLWYSAPVEMERSLLDSTCTHISLVPPSVVLGGMPMFLFQDVKGRQLLVRAPLIATQEQVERWANADSNVFMFLLIERGPKIIRQMRALGVTEDFREKLADAWQSVQHPVDMQKAQAIIADMNDHAVINASVLWAYNPKTDLYERKKSRSAVM